MIEKTKPRGLARVTGGEGTARRTVGLVGSIMSYAVRQGIRTENPCREVERSPDGARDRILSADEYHHLGDALGKLEADGANLVAIAAIRVLALSGCRKGEVFSLRRDAVDYDQQEFLFADTKTGQQVRPIGRSVLEVLKMLPAQDTPWLFSAARGNGHLTDVKLFQRAVKLAKLEDVFHAGDALYVNGKNTPFADYSSTKYRYLEAIKTLHPARQGSTAKDGAKLLTALRTWGWEHPDLAPTIPTNTAVACSPSTRGVGMYAGRRRVMRARHRLCRLGRGPLGVAAPLKYPRLLARETRILSWETLRPDRLRA